MQLTNLQQLCDAEDTRNWYPGNVNSSKSAGVAINTTFTTAQVVWGDYPLMLLVRLLTFCASTAGPTTEKCCSVSESCLEQVTILDMKVGSASHRS